MIEPLNPNIKPIELPDNPENYLIVIIEVEDEPFALPEQWTARMNSSLNIAAFRPDIPNPLEIGLSPYTHTDFANAGTIGSVPTASSRPTSVVVDASLPKVYGKTTAYMSMRHTLVPDKGTTTQAIADAVAAFAGSNLQQTYNIHDSGDASKIIYPDKYQIFGRWDISLEFKNAFAFDIPNTNTRLWHLPNGVYIVAPAFIPYKNSYYAGERNDIEVAVSGLSGQVSIRSYVWDEIVHTFPIQVYAEHLRSNVGGTMLPDGKIRRTITAEPVVVIYDRNSGYYSYDGHNDTAVTGRYTLGATHYNFDIHVDGQIAADYTPTSQGSTVNVFRAEYDENGIPDQLPVNYVQPIGFEHSTNSIGVFQ